MNANGQCRVVSLLIVLPTLLSAQLARQHDPVALKQWLAPLYWQATPASAEEQAVAPAANATGSPANANPLVFVAMPPCRAVDTRTVGQGLTGAFGPPSLVGGASRTFPILSSTTCTIPAVAQAYSVEITVVPPGPLTYVTAFPTGQSAPIAAITVESPQGFMASNTGVIPAGTNGSVDVYASNPTDVVIDINGYYAPISTLPGENTALGAGALASNTTGTNNTASGVDALQNNSTGVANTASGFNALQSNTTGSSNTASGSIALQQNTTGGENSAYGNGALQNNTTGNFNTASGFEALANNTTGGGNNATGSFALANNTTGTSNVADGSSALSGNTTGDNNIAIGQNAAGSVSGGNSNNIHIGSHGAPNDSGTIRIGTPGTQTLFFVAGVRGVTTGANNAIPVVIDSNGQLGTVSSSRRFKEDIEDMGDASSGLLRLRPVTFRYRQPFADGSQPIQYGLIAEEVAEVYPDLVAHSADGQIETVKYQVLDSMLLNELQKEHQQVQQQAETIRLLQIRLAALEDALRSGK
jgi:hypothetical protein